MSDLFEPFRFRNGVMAPNRITLAPLTNQQSHPDGTLSDTELHWLVRHAAGGFGIVTSCAAFVQQDGKAWPGELGVDRDDQIERLGVLATAIRAHHALPMVQLFHGGTRAPSEVSGSRPWSASEYVEDRPGYEVPRAATEADLEGVIEAFAAAAGRCAKAGFAGVELHGAHGYLLSQFLSTTMNVRTDQWGGSLENRARLMRRTMQAVRARVPADFVVGVRLSPEDFGQAKGLDLDETVQVARWLCDDGAEFIHLSLWRTERMTTKRPDEHAIPLFRAACPKDVAIIAAGNLWTRADGEAALARGADLIALGRSAIANPDWANDARDPSWEPRRPPLTRDELVARAASPEFAIYLRQFKGFVAD